MRKVFAGMGLLAGALLAAMPLGCGKSDAGGNGTSRAGLVARPLDLVDECVLILCEAEDGQFEAPFQRGEDKQKHVEESKTPSKRAYLEIPDKAGKGKGAATFKVRVEQPGEYAFWARVWFFDGCGNSFGIEVDGYKITKKIKDEKTKKVHEVIVPPEISDGTFKHWHWVRLIGSNGQSLRFDLARGEHTVVVHNTEDGTKMDQFLFTSELDPDRWYPAGIMTAQ